EDDTFVITDWTWVTDNASILEDGTVTLTHDKTAASAGNGPRKVKVYTGNGGEFTWDDVYNVLPTQVTAQDEDGNVITIALDKSSWTYDGGKKVGEGDCPQSGTYTFEAAISAADGVLADTAKKLQIVVTFDSNDNLLDNGSNTDNGLPNYGVRIVLDMPDELFYRGSAQFDPVFNLQATTTDGRNLVIERYHWDGSKYILSAYKYRSDPTNLYYYQPLGQAEDRSDFQTDYIGFSTDYFHDQGSMNVDWTLRLTRVSSGTPSGNYTTNTSTFYMKADVLVLRDAQVADDDFDLSYYYGCHGTWADTAYGTWKYSISGVLAGSSSITDIQINDGSSDVNPFDITDWTDGSDAASPNRTAAADMSNQGGQVRTIKLTFGEPENPEVDPGELTLSDDIGLPNYGLRVVLDGTDLSVDYNKYVALAIKAATEQAGSDLVLETYAKDSNGIYQLRNTRYSYQINQGTESSPGAVDLDYSNYRVLPEDAAKVPYFRFVHSTDHSFVGADSSIVLVIRPAVAQSSGQAEVSDAKWTVGFMEAITQYPIKLYGIYSSDDTGDPRAITDWTVLDDEGYIEAYDIDVPVTPSAPKTIKLAYRNSTSSGDSGEYFRIYGYKPLYDTGVWYNNFSKYLEKVAGMPNSTPSNNGGPNGDVLIRNDAADYDGDETATYRITISVPDKPINNYWWSNGGQLAFNAFIYDYDPDTQRYTYSDPDSVYSLNTWYREGNSSYLTYYQGTTSAVVTSWGVGPLDNDKSFTVQLKKDQALYIPTNYANKMAFTVKVEVEEGTVLDVQSLISSNNFGEWTPGTNTYVSRFISDWSDYGEGLSDHTWGTHIVVKTSKEKPSIPFTPLSDSGELSDTQEIRTLKTNLFDYEMGYSLLYHVNGINKWSFGHNWNSNDFMNGPGQFRFVYDTTDNSGDPDIDQFYSNGRQGIVADTLGKLLDKDGNVIGYTTPNFNYTTNFNDLFSLTNERTERSDDWEGVPLVDRTKTVYPAVDFQFVYDSEDGSYSYNSHQHHAQLENGTVVQYDKALGLGGVYTDTKKDVDGNYVPSTNAYDVWGDRAAGFFPFDRFGDTNYYGKTYESVGVSNDGTTLLRKENELDYHFGLSMEHQFTVPYDGTINGHDMVFSISGDDDIWLFVDGKLILDLGGIHEALSGEINFTKGTYTVNGVTKPLAEVLDGYAGSYPGIPASSATTGSGAGSAARSNPTTGGSTWAWAGGTDHTFQLFYLERGGTLSDLSISFNLPQVVVTATKVWDDEDNKDNTRQDVVLKVQQSTDGKSFTDVADSSKTISKDATGDDLTVQWTNLPLYNEQGKKLEYRVVEQEMEGYTATIVHDGYDYTVTNTYVPDEPTPPDVPDEPTPPDVPDEPTTPDEPTPPNVPDEPTSGEPQTPTKPHTPNKASKTPKTGDESHVGLWVAVLTVSGVAAAAGVVLTKRKRNK
ncbi:MAG: Cna B-type domain-containing protein, partial [Oscillospiraceae bacterium]|nr:Cna B-type domain-containing protein [Oscillospiraceae bacterium]